ncbi:hypothetical protein KKG61_03555 [bacterium]|nr:hypothetical protein [bacterium]
MKKIVLTGLVMGMVMAGVSYGTDEKQREQGTVTSNEEATEISVITKKDNTKYLYYLVDIIEIGGRKADNYSAF